MKNVVSSALAVCSFATTVATAGPRLPLDPRASAADPPTGSVCSGPIRCQAHARVTPDGEVQPFAAATGLGPTDLWAAYDIDPNITTHPTVAIVDAFGYANLESDLAVYRQNYNLPPCTRANGCLTIVNQNNQTSPLPTEAPTTDDWTLETALDVDAVSAACPLCRIVVVQANTDADNSLYVAQAAALARGATVISNSWGAIEPTSDVVAQLEPNFHHPGIATFASSGDYGYDYGGKGPLYPSTSSEVISVGGTHLVAQGTGWVESAWTSAGSSCSGVFAKPGYQTTMPCANRATTEVSAVADPNTGIAVYNAKDGGWLVVGGTSLSSPLIAAMFAAIGHGDVTPDLFPHFTAALRDVTTGSNGACGTTLCNAATGWDGPTGYGTPDLVKLTALLSGNGGGGGGGGGGAGPTISIVAPQDGAMVAAGFEVDANGANATAVALMLDGVLVNVEMAPPFSFSTPVTLPAGPHVVQLVAYGADNSQVAAQVHVTVAASAPQPPPNADSGGLAGGCSASQGTSSLALVGLALLLAARRRIRSAWQP